MNLGANIGPDPLPLRFKGGVAYKMLDEKLLLAADLDWRAQDKLLYEDLGVEGWVNKALALRAGYEIGHANTHLGSALVGFSFGLGLRVDNFRFDYAFLPFGNLGDTHRVTLGYMF